MLNKLFVFDIETIPDTQTTKILLDLQDEQDEDVLAEKLRQYHLNITDGKNDFPRQLFHQVVAISFLDADIEYTPEGEIYHINDLRSGGKIDSSERELVEGFFQFFGANKPRLISFNGKGFDLPVLKYRAMKYGVQSKALFQSGDKWSNYNTKFSTDWHCDLIDALSDYGSSARIKISEVCALLGIPCKIDCSGADVFTMYKEGRQQEIRDYCEIDVINTYMVYLRYQLFRGAISKRNYNIMLEDLQSLLQSEPQKASFASFLSECDLNESMLKNVA